jgi:hypothetical protein
MILILLIFYIKLPVLRIRIGMKSSKLRIWIRTYDYQSLFESGFEFWTSTGTDMVHTTHKITKLDPTNILKLPPSEIFVIKIVLLQVSGQHNHSPLQYALHNSHTSRNKQSHSQVQFFFILKTRIASFKYWRKGGWKNQLTEKRAFMPVILEQRT